MRGPHALALPLALLFGLLPANAAGQTPPPRWLGIQLGQPASELRSLLGDPVLVTRFPLDQSPGAPQRPERKARYTLSLQEPLYALVSERHGVIVGIEAFSPRPLTAEQASVVPDPSGVRLGSGTTLACSAVNGRGEKASIPTITPCRSETRAYSGSCNESVYRAFRSGRCGAPGD